MYPCIFIAYVDHVQYVVDLDLHVRVDLLDLDLLASSISNYYVVDLPVTLEE